MAKQLNRLKALEVKSLSKIGRHADGGNLYLSVARDGSRSWTFMYKLNGRQREGGLGAAAQVTLSQARAKAQEWRRLLSEGTDPLDHKQAASEVARATADKPSFGVVAQQLIKSRGKGWRNAKHRQQWMLSSERYAVEICKMPVEQVGSDHVLAALKPLWDRIPATASRVRGRIESVLDYASAHKMRSGPNPATWRGHLAHIFHKPVSGEHHRALAYQDLPAFMAQLPDTLPGLALQFIVLTASRSGEALGALWSEVDAGANIWTIAASRMKANRQHRVPLSMPALAILEQLAAVKSSPLIFAGYKAGKALNRSGVYQLCHDAGTSCHGMRSVFRDWSGDRTDFAREVIEAALAHSIGDSTEAAYRRSDSLEKRRALMEQWASFCCGKP